MTVSEAEQNIMQNQGKHLFLEYPWFYEHIYGKLKDTINDFFQKDYFIRFMGVSFDDENVLFFGDEYFVGKFPVNKSASVELRISAGLISSLLDNSLGISETKFKINALTDIEAMLIKAYTKFMYDKIDELIIKNEPNKKVLKNSKIYNFTFYVEYKEKHTGKIILSLPDYTISDNIQFEYRDDCFDISCFDDIKSAFTLRVGATRISLNDIKAIENGDVIMLEDSDVNEMAILWQGEPINFNITPNPTLIISVDSTGDGEMSDNSMMNADNMWDTILVDVVAEFDNFKLTLGELKQISEGLVIDVGSIYNSKVKLRVAKQVVASGELVILNDRYGVRIDTVKNSSDDVEYEEVDETDDIGEESTSAKGNANSSQEGQGNPAAPEGAQNNENFNYSDFEIEDESI